MMKDFLRKLFYTNKYLIPKETISIIQSSYKKVQPKSTLNLFYTVLSQENPSLISILPVSTKETITLQEKNILNNINNIIANLADFDTLIPTLQKLAKKHFIHKVDAVHYSIIGYAILSSLETNLGNEFTHEVEDAWSDIYGLISAVMIEATYT